MPLCCSWLVGLASTCAVVAATAAAAASADAFFSQSEGPVGAARVLAADDECHGAKSPDDGDGHCGTSLLQVRGRKLGEEASEENPRDESFRLPFAYSIMGPGGSLVARLIVPLTGSCPEELEVRSSSGGFEQRHQVPVSIRAEPMVGHGLFFLENQAYNTMNGLNLSIANPHPAFNFPDRVCEARLDAAAAAVASEARFGGRHGSAGLSVPLPPADPSKFVVLGDTGMRIKSKNDGWCNGKPKHTTLNSGKTCEAADMANSYDPKKVSGMFQVLNDTINPALNGWPFGRVAAAASEEVWRSGGGDAIVVHVGDYIYRHEACPMPFPTELTEKQQEEHRIFGDCTAAGASWGDTHESWVADFFEPAAPLLRAAPWMVFRGNHETCKRGGMGWFRYLDPGPPGGGVVAPADAVAYPWCLASTPPYSVDFAHDQWLVLDTSAIIHEDVSIDHVPQIAFTAQIAEVLEGCEVQPMGPRCISTSQPDAEKNLPIVDGLMDLVHPGKRHWIGTHRPVNGLAFEKVDHGGPAALLSFQCEVANVAALAKISVPDVAAIVSGHVHYFQLVQYQSGVSQIMLGNGGTQLKTPLNGEPIGLERVASKRITVLGDLVENSPTVGEWGYGILEAGGASPAEASRLTAKFLSDSSFQGSPDVTADLPLRTWSVAGTAWLNSTQARACQADHQQ